MRTFMRAMPFVLAFSGAATRRATAGEWGDGA